MEYLVTMTTHVPDGTPAREGKVAFMQLKQL